MLVAPPTKKAHTPHTHTIVITHWCIIIIIIIIFFFLSLLCRLLFLTFLLLLLTCFSLSLILLWRRETPLKSCAINTIISTHSFSPSPFPSPTVKRVWQSKGKFLVQWCVTPSLAMAFSRICNSVCNYRALWIPSTTCRVRRSCSLILTGQDVCYYHFRWDLVLLCHLYIYLPVLIFMAVWVGIMWYSDHCL